MHPPFTINLLAALLALAAPVRAGDGVWSAGMATQGFVDFEPGNDFVSGVSIGYSNHNLFFHRLELQALYLTSRAEAAYREILRQDWFMASPVWHFRRNATFDPTLQVDFGYQRYDTEFDWARDLKNSTLVYGGKLGLRINFFESRFNLHYAFGYQAATSESSLVFPLPFSAGFTVLFL